MYNSMTSYLGKYVSTYYVSKDGKCCPKQVSKSTYYRYKRIHRIREYVNSSYGYKQHIIEVLL